MNTDYRKTLESSVQLIKENIQRILGQIDQISFADTAGIKNLEGLLASQEAKLKEREAELSTLNA